MPLSPAQRSRAWPETCLLSLVVLPFREPSSRASLESWRRASQRVEAPVPGCPGPCSESAPGPPRRQRGGTLDSTLDPYKGARARRGLGTFECGWKATSGRATLGAHNADRCRQLRLQDPRVARGARTRANRLGDEDRDEDLTVCSTPRHRRGERSMSMNTQQTQARMRQLAGEAAAIFDGAEAENRELDWHERQEAEEKMARFKDLQAR